MAQRERDVAAFLARREEVIAPRATRPKSGSAAWARSGPSATPSAPWRTPARRRGGDTGNDSPRRSARGGSRLSARALGEPAEERPATRLEPRGALRIRELALAVTVAYAVIAEAPWVAVRGARAERAGDDAQPRPHAASVLALVRHRLHPPAREAISGRPGAGWTPKRGVDKLTLSTISSPYAKERSGGASLRPATGADAARAARPARGAGARATRPAEPARGGAAVRRRRVAGRTRSGGAAPSQSLRRRASHGRDRRSADRSPRGAGRAADRGAHHADPARRACRWRPRREPWG